MKALYTIKQHGKLINSIIAKDQREALRKTGIDAVKGLSVKRSPLPSLLQEQVV